MALLVHAEWRRRPAAPAHQDTHNPPAEALAPEPWAPSPAGVEQLTDEQLCWAWRTSYAQLQRGPAPTQAAAFADRRSAYLNEIARRHPDGFARWIASGARAGSDPTRFLHPPTGPHERPLVPPP